MNVLLVALHPTVALLNVNNVHEYVMFPLVNAFVLTHTQSVHVNVIVHATHHDIHAFVLGAHQLHIGFVVSLHVPVYVVSALIVTLAPGSKLPFHFGVEYHALVLHVILVNDVVPLVAVFHIVIVPLVAQIFDTHVLFTYVNVSTFLYIAYTVLFPFNVILFCALFALLLVFHHTNVHPFFVAGYVLVDNVTLAPLNL